MDNWYKFKDKSNKKIDLNKVDIASVICYGNYLIAEIAWLASQNKVKQKTINKFFNVATTVLQATVAQKGFKQNELAEIYTYIDNITKDLNGATITTKEIGLMLGNLSELEGEHYTFTELIGFVRSIAAKI